MTTMEIDWRCALRSSGSVLLFAVSMIGAGARAEAQAAAGPLVFSDVLVVGRSEAISYVISSTIDDRGNVYALDPDNRWVLKFAPDGELLWRSGRRGGGPGEYELPTRIAVGPTGNVYVYDMARQGVTVLDSSGTYVSYTRFSLPVRNPDRILVLDDGRVALSGIAEFLRGAGRAVHVYSPSLDHQLSFGELPVVRDPENARMWGAGGITLGPEGTILFARRLPYEIYQYTPDGALVRRFQSSVRIDLTPDDAYVTTRNGPQVVTSLGADVPRPLPAVAIGDKYFLTGLGKREKPVRHLYSLSRGFVGEVALPSGWDGVLGYDPERGYIWGYGEFELEPVLFRARVHVREL